LQSCVLFAPAPVTTSHKFVSFSTFVCLFVDDIIIARNNDAHIEAAKKGLEKHCSLTDQGALRWCVGMRVNRNRSTRTIQLDQHHHILDVLARFDVLKCKPASTPMCRRAAPTWRGAVFTRPPLLSFICVI